MKPAYSTLILFAAFSLLLFSCKKSNTTPAPASTSTSSPSYGGELQVNNSFHDNTLNGGGSDSTGSAITLLYSAVNIGTVTMNTFTLTFQFNTYFIPTGVIAPVTGKPSWSVTGGSGYGAFTFTTSKNVPYVGNLHLQGNFSKSANLVLTHSTIFADSIAYIITDINSNQVRKVVANSSSGVTFTPAMMATLSTGSNASIQVNGISTEFSVQGGKNLKFLNSYSYQKNGITIN